MSYDPWATPGTTTTTTTSTTTTSPDGWAPPPPAPLHDRRKDVLTGLAIILGMVLLGAPAGLLWAKVAPHYTVVFDKDGNATYPFIESTKAFIGADGSYFVVMLALGLLSGSLVWWKARSAGPWAVIAMVIGGFAAALIAARVGLLPGSKAAFHAIDAKKGSVDIFLGQRDKHGHLSLRAPWAALAWPLGALIAFAGPAFVRPEELD